MPGDIVLGIRLTADGKGLVGEVRLSREELDKLKEATKGVEAAAGAAKNEMMSWTEFVKSRMGPAMREFHEQGKTHAEAHTLAIRKIAQEWREYKRTNETAADAAKRLNDEQKNLSAGLAGLATRIGLSTAAWSQLIDITIRAARAVKDYIQDAVLLNARHEEMGVAMQVVGHHAGYSGAQMDQFAKGLQAAGITMIESREALLRMASAQMDLSSSAQLARIAQDAAVAGAINSSEAFQRLIYAIQSGQPEMLRTMGINVNFEASYQKLAKSLKVTTEQLSEQEKMQARTNAVIEFGTQITGLYEAAMGTASKQIRSLARYTEDLKVLRGEIFNEALVIAVNAYTDALKDANTAARQLSDNEKFKEWGRDAIIVFARLADTAGFLARAFAQIIESAEVVGLTVGAALFGWSKEYRDFVRSFTDQANERMAKRWGGSQAPMSDAANKFFAQRDADAAERARQNEEDLRDAAMARAFGLRTGPKPQPRPGGKTSAQDPYQTLIEGLRKKLMLDKESTEIERVEHELTEQRYLKGGKLNEQKALYVRLLARAVDLYKADLAALAAENTALEEQDQIRHQAAATIGDMYTKAFLAADESVQKLEQENELLGKIGVDRERAIALLDLERLAAKDTAGVYKQFYEEYRDRINKAFDLKAQHELMQKNREEAKRFNEELGRGIADALMRGFESGKDFARNFRDTLVNMFKTLILRPVIQWIISPVSGAITAMLGGLGIPGLANAAGAGGGFGAAGNLLSFGGNFLGAGQFLADIPNFFGSIGAVTEAGTTFGLLDAIGGFAAAHPLGVAGLALGALGLGRSLFGGGGSPAYPTYGEIYGTATAGGVVAPSFFANSASAEEAYRWQVSGNEVGTWAAALPLMGQRLAQLYAELGRMGGILGLDTSRLGAAQAAIALRVPQRPGAAGISTEEVMAQFEAQLGGITDQLAQQLMPNLKDFAQANETLAQTFTRLSQARTQANIEEIFGRMNAAMKLADATRDLWLSNLSPLTAAERLREASTRYGATLTAARAGGIGATSELAQLSRTYLTEARGYYASSADYTSIFGAVQRDVEGLVSDTLTEQSMRFADMGISLGEIAQNTRDLDRRIAEALDRALAAREQARAATQAAQDAALLATQSQAIVTPIVTAIEENTRRTEREPAWDDGGD